MDKNDILYYGDPSYDEELTEIIGVVVEMLVTCLDQDDDKVPVCSILSICLLPSSPVSMTTTAFRIVSPPR